MTADASSSVHGSENDSGNVPSFTMVKASELYPMAPTVKNDGCEELALPFSPVPGEFLTRLTETRDGLVLAVSNYRVHICWCDHGGNGGGGGLILNVPLTCVESCEQRDLFHLLLSCRDGRLYRIQLETNAACELWHGHVSAAVADAAAAPTKIQEVFAFAHHAWALESRFEELSGGGGGVVVNGEEVNSTSSSGWFKSETARLRFDVQGAWRITVANKDHRLCPTYPPELLVPASVTDVDLEKIAQFRSARRFPAVVWRHVDNGAILARCSQPRVGWLGWRLKEDEDLIRAMADASAFDRCRHSSGELSDDDRDVDGIPSLKDLAAAARTTTTTTNHHRDLAAKDVLIVDARSYTAAVGNRARGGGVECLEYYPNTEILFMNLENIHYIRKSFQALRVLCNSPADQTSWFQALDGTKWLHCCSALLKSAVRVVTALHVEGRPVVVHCTDGWDRTPQIVALAELMLDPYYRSVKGFQVLVEKEWLDFGHKMADRCGLAVCTSDLNERSPIFLQWLDCVHQLLLQFPCSFEFNLSYLVKLARHTYSSLFGTFLCNSLLERKQNRIREQTRQVWGFFDHHPFKFRNLLYARRDDVLWPRTEVRDLLLWRDVYVSSEQRTINSNNNNNQTADSGASCSNSREESENEAADTTNISLVKEELEKLKKEDGDDDEEEVRVTATASSPKSIQLQKLLVGANDANEASTDTLVPDLDVRRVDDDKTSKDLQPVNNDRPAAAFKNGDSPASDVSVNGGEEGEFMANSKLEEPFDSDGLPAHHNEVQRRMVAIFSAHNAEVQRLRRDLHMTRMALCRNKLSAGTAAAASPAAAAAAVNGQQLNDGGEDAICKSQHANAANSSASDGSSTWEAVDEGDGKPQILWVPDHAMPTCLRCHTKFWFGKRKHHCRNCGQLVCGDCSDNLAPVPSQQLLHPVRICDHCFGQLYPERKRQSDCPTPPEEQPPCEEEEGEAATSVIVGRTDDKEET